MVRIKLSRPPKALWISTRGLSDFAELVLRCGQIFGIDGPIELYLNDGLLDPVHSAIDVLKDDDEVYVHLVSSPIKAAPSEGAASDTSPSVASSAAAPAAAAVGGPHGKANDSLPPRKKRARGDEPASESKRHRSRSRLDVFEAVGKLRMARRSVKLRAHARHKIYEGKLLQCTKSHLVLKDKATNVIHVVAADKITHIEEFAPPHPAPQQRDKCNEYTDSGLFAAFPGSRSVEDHPIFTQTLVIPQGVFERGNVDAVNDWLAMELATLKNKVRRQFRFWFTRENLAADTYLMNKLKVAKNRLPLPTLLQFNTVKNLHVRDQFVVDCLVEGADEASLYRLELEDGRPAARVPADQLVIVSKLWEDGAIPTLKELAKQTASKKSMQLDVTGSIHSPLVPAQIMKTAVAAVAPPPPVVTAPAVIAPTPPSVTVPAQPIVIAPTPAAVIAPAPTIIQPPTIIAAPTVRSAVAPAKPALGINPLLRDDLEPELPLAVPLAVPVTVPVTVPDAEMAVGEPDAVMEPAEEEAAPPPHTRVESPATAKTKEFQPISESSTDEECSAPKPSELIEQFLYARELEVAELTPLQPREVKQEWFRSNVVSPVDKRPIVVVPKVVIDVEKELSEGEIVEDQEEEESISMSEGAAAGV